MDQLSAMRVFVQVVETGNFSRVSERLSIPKTTVTTLIQGLEAHLQTKLLNRTTRRVVVTTDGALYYERALRLLADMDDLDASFTNSRDNTSGRIRVEMAGVFCDAIVIPALREFHKRYPDIRVDIGVGDRTADYLAENVDCALRTGTPSDLSLIVRQVAEMRFVTCASPDYVARHGKPGTPEDLKRGHKIVGFLRPHTGQTFGFHLRNGEDYFEFEPDYSVSVSDSRSYMTAGENGLGIVQAPDLTARKAIASGEMVPILEGWERDPMTVYVVYPPNRHLSNKVRVFVDWLIELFAEFKRTGGGSHAGAEEG